MNVTEKRTAAETPATARQTRHPSGGGAFGQRREGGVNTVLLIALVFVLGMGAGAWWVYRSTHAAPAATPQSNLTEGTRSILQNLGAAVEIRFYSILDPSSVTEAQKGLAGRVDQLLTYYEQEGNGKIKLTKLTSVDNADAASADGLKAFNLDKGNPCYLGIAVVGPGGKESLPLLSTEWEPAIEPDISRAIARVAQAPAPAGKAAVASVKVSPAAIDEVKKAIPDLASTSLEDGTRILREAGLNEFKAAAAEMEAQIKAAQDKIVQAQASGSQADREAAIKNLQQVQLEQAEKLKQIAAKSQAQIDALKQLKATPR